MFLIFAGMSCVQFHSFLFESRGFSPIELGLVLMIGSAAGIFSPLVQVHLIRLFGGPGKPLVLLLTGAAISLALLPHVRGLGATAGLFFLGAFSMSGIYPLNTSSSLDATRSRGHGAFLKIRSLGTIGFFLGCLASLSVVEIVSFEYLYAGFSLAFLISIPVVLFNNRTLTAPRKADASTITGTRLSSAPTFRQALRLLREPNTFRLLCVLASMSFANSLALSVQGNYIIHHFRSGPAAISMAWMLATFFEIPLMFLCVRILLRNGLVPVLSLGIIGTGIKLAAMALSQELWQYFLALTLHGFFYAGAASGFGIYLDRMFREEDRSSIQALTVALYVGIPSAFGGLISGWIWQQFSLHAVYWVSGFIACAATFAGFFNMGRLRTAENRYEDGKERKEAPDEVKRQKEV